MVSPLTGEPLAPARGEHFYGGLVSYTAARGGLPERINTHDWFHFDLPPEGAPGGAPGSVRQGENRVEVTLARRFAPLAADRVLHGVEIRVAYREPPVPVGGQM